MSLYPVQKSLSALNRDPRSHAYPADREEATRRFELTDEERAALDEADIGLLFHLGVTVRS